MVVLFCLHGKWFAVLSLVGVEVNIIFSRELVCRLNHVQLIDTVRVICFEPVISCFWYVDVRPGVLTPLVDEVLEVIGQRRFCSAV